MIGGMSGKFLIWFLKRNLLPTIKHGASNIMIWKCFAATGTGKIICIDGTIDSAGYQAILNESLLSSVRKLGLGHRQIFQEDNDPKHQNKLTKEWVPKKKFQVLEWPSQRPDLNPTENLWFKLKKAGYARSPGNIKQLREFCQKEWSKIKTS